MRFCGYVENVLVRPGYPAMTRSTAAAVSAYDASPATVTHSSPELTSPTWSEVTARPTCPPTLATPGRARSSPAAAAVIRLISWSEVPAIALQCTTRVLSARTGTTGRDPASCGAMARPASATTAAAAKTHRLFAVTRATRLPYPPSNRARARRSGRGADPAGR